MSFGRDHLPIGAMQCNYNSYSYFCVFLCRVFVEMLFIASCLISGVFAHSWADNVGGGSYRGGQGANDLVKERYFCPLSDLAACQPGHGIVLTANSMRACRTDYSTPTWGNGVAGQPMYVHWAGNGHTSAAQSASTCVKIAIAPYALDPDMSSFTTLAACLPFSHGADITDAYVTLPSNLLSGKYTVFWLWDFAPFWFTSCSDINVTGSGGATTTLPTTTASTKPIASTTVGGTTTKQPTTGTTVTTKLPTTTKRPTTTVKTSVTTGSGSGADCRSYSLPNAQCQALFGSTSYCVSWQLDGCGKARCAGAPPVAGCSGSGSSISR